MNFDKPNRLSHLWDAPSQPPRHTTAVPVASIEALAAQYAELAKTQDKLAKAAGEIGITGATPADIESWRSLQDGRSRLALLDDTLARLSAGASAAATREDAVRLVGLIMNVVAEVDEALAGELAGELDELPPEEQPAFNALVAMIRPLRKACVHSDSLANKLRGKAPFARRECAHVTRLMKRMCDDVSNWLHFHEEYVVRLIKRSVPLAAERDVAGLLARIGQLERSIEATLRGITG